MQSKLLYVTGLVLMASTTLLAQDQSQVGPGNATAAATAAKSAQVQSAMAYIKSQTMKIHDGHLMNETLDGIQNPKTCIHHRANLTTADKQEIVQQLLAAGLVDPADGASIPGGLMAGVFPGVLNDGTSCPQFPQPFESAPGSVFGSHHSYPGGLPIHESNNDTADVNLAREYREMYGNPSGATGFPTINVADIESGATDPANDLFINEDIIVGAPLWHDWAKPMVYQWNADGSEYIELNIGDTNTSKTLGAAKTGGHHILSIAESMSRGFDPAFIITQASAHGAPTPGSEFKVVNWLRAAAIVARIDPVAAGILTVDSTGAYRLAPLRKLGQVNLNANGQNNLLVEYQLHNLSDADFTESGAAITISQVVLAQLAPQFGYNPIDVANYNNKYRNVVLSQLTAERFHILFAQGGTGAIVAQLKVMKSKGLI